MTDPVIRRAMLADAPAMTEAFSAAYAPFLESIPDMPDVTDGISEDIDQHLTWVCELDGRIVGGLVLILDGETALLANIAVHPEAGGRGIGRALIAAAEAEARAAGASQIDLATHVDMPANLVLYERLGWREVERSGSKVRMSKPL